MITGGSRCYWSGLLFIAWILANFNSLWNQWYRQRKRWFVLRKHFLYYKKQLVNSYFITSSNIMYWNKYYWYKRKALVKEKTTIIKQLHIFHKFASSSILTLFLFEILEASKRCFKKTVTTLWPFLAIFLPTTIKTFTIPRFWWIFWSAKHV